MALLVGLFAAGTATSSLVKDVSSAEAAYIALLTEFGGRRPGHRGASGVERVTMILLTVVSIAVIPALTADGGRLGGARRGCASRPAASSKPISDHMVVVGLGDVGTRVMRPWTTRA